MIDEEQRHDRASGSSWPVIASGLVFLGLLVATVIAWFPGEATVSGRIHVSETDSGRAPALVSPTTTTPVELGRQLFLTKGCGGCHRVAALAEATGQIGPPLSTIGDDAGTRRAGRDAAGYIRESISEPEVFWAPGYEGRDPMPKLPLAETEIDALVAFLLTNRRIPAPTAARS
ncbi:MAG: cytochrome c [Chloroflexi bacterium]|nr:cytochrome c [Chloroflexota bacterium]